MKKSLLLVLCVVLGCASVEGLKEFQFSEPHEVGSYSVYFESDISERGRSVVTDALLFAQKKVPEVDVPMTLYVYNEYVHANDFRMRIMGAAGYNEESGSISFVLTPFFHASDREDRRVIAIHEMVHAYLYSLGLIEKDVCTAAVHERIAYAVTRKMYRLGDPARLNALKQMMHFDKQLRTHQCDMERFKRFQAEFEKYE